MQNPVVGQRTSGHFSNGLLREKSAKSLPRACFTKNSLRNVELLSPLDSNAYFFHLKVCIQRKSLVSAKQIHAHIIKSGYEVSILLANCLINTYISCESIRDARNFFDTMIERDKFTWTIMIGGHVLYKDCKEGIGLFGHMQQYDLQPDEVTYVNVFSACSQSQSLQWGKFIHAYLLSAAYILDVFVSSAILAMYAKCGSINDAYQMFNNMNMRNVVAWTAMISGYADHELGNEALVLFSRMLNLGVKPNKVTYISILRVCSNLRALEFGKHIHVQLADVGLDKDASIGNTLIDMYVKCGNIESARIVFDRMSTRNLISYTVMITGYSQHGNGNEGMKLFFQLQQQCLRPNKFTYVSFLCACASVGALAWGKYAHTCIMKDALETDSIVGNSLVSMYAKCGSLKEACQLFEMLVSPDIVSWTAIISGYALFDEGYKAIRYFWLMQEQGFMPDNVAYVSVFTAAASESSLGWGKCVHSHFLNSKTKSSDIVISNALIDMYGKCESIEYACQIFDRMQDQDVISWSGLILAYGQYGLLFEAIRILEKMEALGLEPDSVTCGNILNACASAGNLHHGRRYHASFIKSGLNTEIFLGNCIIDMYIKSGSIMEAEAVFDRMTLQDDVSWLLLISGYAQYEKGNVSIKLFERANHLKSDKGTCITVLRVCANQGALVTGKHTHSSILKDERVPDLLMENSLIGMYFKCGCISDAHHVFDNMYVRDVISWTTMISGHAQHGNEHEALQIFKEMQQDGFKPDKVAFLSCLTACSYKGVVNEGFQLLMLMSCVYKIGPGSEHFACLVDLLCRAGCLHEAKDLNYTVPFEPSDGIFMALVEDS